MCPRPARWPGGRGGVPQSTICVTTGRPDTQQAARVRAPDGRPLPGRGTAGSKHPTRTIAVRVLMRAASAPLTWSAVHLQGVPKSWTNVLTSRYGLEIRAAMPNDAPGLVTLLGTVGHVIGAARLAELLLAVRQASSTALVAVQWGPPSGIVVMHWYPTLHAPRPTAQVTTLLVNADERRQGIGRLLVKAAAQAARAAGCGDLEVLAPPEAPTLEAFCRATGFAEAGQSFVRSLRKQG